MRQRLHAQFVLQKGRQLAGGYAARRTAGTVGHTHEVRLQLGHLPQRGLQLFIAHRLLRGEYFHGEYTGLLRKQLANVHTFDSSSFIFLPVLACASRGPTMILLHFTIIQYPGE